MEFIHPMERFISSHTATRAKKNVPSAASIIRTGRSIVYYIYRERDKPRLALKSNTAGVREREDANRTREAGHLDEIQEGANVFHD